jgi:hypothetical protein
VSNTLGQQVAPLENGEREAGDYEAMLNASGLSSGVYFYRMQAGSFVETKTLLLVRWCLKSSQFVHAFLKLAS